MLSVARVLRDKICRAMACIRLSLSGRDSFCRRPFSRDIEAQWNVGVSVRDVVACRLQLRRQQGTCSVDVVEDVTPTDRVNHMVGAASVHLSATAMACQVRLLPPKCFFAFGAGCGTRFKVPPVPTLCSVGCHESSPCQADAHDLAISVCQRGWWPESMDGVGSRGTLCDDARCWPQLR